MSPVVLEPHATFFFVELVSCRHVVRNHQWDFEQNERENEGARDGQTRLATVVAQDQITQGTDSVPWILKFFFVFKILHCKKKKDQEFRTPFWLNLPSCFFFVGNQACFLSSQNRLVAVVFHLGAWWPPWTRS